MFAVSVALLSDFFLGPSPDPTRMAQGIMSTHP